jgi:xylulokinase
MGYLSVDDIADHVEIARTYQPDPKNRNIYDRLYGQFLALYKRNKPIFKRLNRA